MPYTEAQRKACAKYIKSHKEVLRKRRKEWAKANPEKARAQWLRDYERRKEYHRLRKKQYRAKNREYTAELYRKWRERNREAINIKRKVWVSNNREKANSHIRKWRAENPGAASHYDGLRRSKQKACPLSESKVIKRWMNDVKSKPFSRCHWCGTKVSGCDIHFDHVIPLTKGGHHEIGNLCASCCDCNKSKHARLISDWMCNGQRFLL